MMNTRQTKLNTNTLSIVHLVRHGHIPNHRADHPLTSEGRQAALAAGRELANHIRPGETINFFSSPTRRTRQTAELLRDGLCQTLSAVNLAAAVAPIIVVDDRLRNLQFYFDGLSYDPIQPLFEVARWRLQQTPSAQYEACVAFHAEFWSSPDPMDYWLTHPSDAVESPEAVAGRTRAYLAERLGSVAEGDGLRRDICVAHAANLRAFLRLVFGNDPGEPPFCGMASIRDGRVYYEGQVGIF